MLKKTLFLVFNYIFCSQLLFIYSNHHKQTKFQNLSTQFIEGGG